eukprot:tig00021127_g18820.t1
MARPAKRARTSREDESAPAATAGPDTEGASAPAPAPAAAQSASAPTAAVQAAAGPTGLAAFPAELVAHVLSFLDPSDKLKASLVCRAWSEIVYTVPAGGAVLYVDLAQPEGRPWQALGWRRLRALLASRMQVIHLTVRCSGKKPPGAGRAAAALLALAPHLEALALPEALLADDRTLRAAAAACPALRALDVHAADAVGPSPVVEALRRLLAAGSFPRLAASGCLLISERMTPSAAPACVAIARAHPGVSVLNCGDAVLGAGAAADFPAHYAEAAAAPNLRFREMVCLGQFFAALEPGGPAEAQLLALVPRFRRLSLTVHSFCSREAIERLIRAAAPTLRGLHLRVMSDLWVLREVATSCGGLEELALVGYDALHRPADVDAALRALAAGCPALACLSFAWGRRHLFPAPLLRALPELFPALRTLHLEPLAAQAEAPPEAREAYAACLAALAARAPRPGPAPGP